MNIRKMFYGANKNAFRKAFLLRNKETETEKILWQLLNKNQLSGFRFKRQHPIGDYIADFYCHKAKLVIEIDGEYHNSREQKLYDDNREKTFEELGLVVLRFSDEEIFQSIDRVIQTIKNNLQKNP